MFRLCDWLDVPAPHQALLQILHPPEDMVGCQGALQQADGWQGCPGQCPRQIHQRLPGQAH